MKALILAGGYGTRLHPLTLRTAKCVLPVGLKPNIVHIIENLREAGIDEVILSFNTNQERFKSYLGDGSEFGVRIRYILEETEDDSTKLGAVGAIRYVVEQAGADDYLIVGADNYFEGLDIKEMLRFHSRTGADATLALYYLEDETMVERLGIAVTEGDRIVGFQEKPKLEDAKSRLGSILVYMVNRDFMERCLPEYIDEMAQQGEKPDNPGDMWAHFVDKLKVNGYTFKGYWTDIGNNKSYLEANAKAMEGLGIDIAEGARISKRAKVSEDRLVIGKGTTIEEGAVVRGPVIIGENCVVKSGAVIGPNTIVLDNSLVGRNSTVDSSIVFEKVRIGERVKMESTIADGSAVIEDDATIEAHSMVGHGAKLCKGARLTYESRVWPGISIARGSEINGAVMGDNRIIRSCYWEP